VRTRAADPDVDITGGCRRYRESRQKQGGEYHQGGETYSIGFHVVLWGRMAMVYPLRDGLERPGRVTQEAERKFREMEFAEDDS
jgi:hypothetical protein